jgi:HNH endonuclease
VTKTRNILRPRQFWKAEELALVRELYPDTSTQQLADQLGRPLHGVYRAAAKMGLHKSETYLASPEACRLRRGDQVGKASRYPRGHVPANKGLRRPGWSPGRMASTQFRKGELTGSARQNWKPIGTILADHEGYLRIKIREGIAGQASGFGNTKIWPLLQRHVWEQNNGPIPSGHAIVFKNGDRANCAIENLECISRGELCKRNSGHRWGQEMFEVIQLRGVLNRKLRTLSEKQNIGSTQPSL